MPYQIPCASLAASGRLTPSSRVVSRLHSHRHDILFISRRARLTKVESAGFRLNTWRSPPGVFPIAEDRNGLWHAYNDALRSLVYNLGRRTEFDAAPRFLPQSAIPWTLQE
jgi:hypothetical protein